MSPASDIESPRQAPRRRASSRFQPRRGFTKRKTPCLASSSADPRHERRAAGDRERASDSTPPALSAARARLDVNDRDRLDASGARRPAADDLRGPAGVAQTLATAASRRAVDVGVHHSERRRVATTLGAGFYKRGRKLRCALPTADSSVALSAGPRPPPSQRPSLASTAQQPTGQPGRAPASPARGTRHRRQATQRAQAPRCRSAAPPCSTPSPGQSPRPTQSRPRSRPAARAPPPQSHRDSHPVPRAAHHRDAAAAERHARARPPSRPPRAPPTPARAAGSPQTPAATPPCARESPRGCGSADRRPSATSCRIRVPPRVRDAAVHPRSRSGLPGPVLPSGGAAGPGGQGERRIRRLGGNVGLTPRREPLAEVRRRRAHGDSLAGAARVYETRGIPSARSRRAARRRPVGTRARHGERRRVAAPPLEALSLSCAPSPRRRPPWPRPARPRACRRDRGAGAAPSRRARRRRPRARRRSGRPDGSRS